MKSNFKYAAKLNRRWAKSVIRSAVHFLSKLFDTENRKMLPNLINEMACFEESIISILGEADSLLK